MNSANTTGRKNANTRAMSDKCCRRHGRCASQSAGDSDREIAARDLSDIIRRSKMLDLFARKTDTKLPVKYGNRRGNGSAVADGLLHSFGRFEILRIWETVRDNGRFERNDWRSSLKCRSDLIAKVKVHFI
jgi:hypothetical protein